MPFFRLTQLCAKKSRPRWSKLSNNTATVFFYVDGVSVIGTWRCGVVGCCCRQFPSQTIGSVAYFEREILAYRVYRQDNARRGGGNVPFYRVLAIIISNMAQWRKVVPRHVFRGRGTKLTEYSYLLTEKSRPREASYVRFGSLAWINVGTRKEGTESVSVL